MWQVKNFQCRAFQHKVFVFSNEEWAVLKEANWPNFGLPHGLGSSMDVPDVVPCNGDFYSLEGSSIWRLSTAAQVRLLLNGHLTSAGIPRSFPLLLYSSACIAVDYVCRVGSRSCNL